MKKRMNPAMLLSLIALLALGVPAFTDDWDDDDHRYVKDEQRIDEDLGGISTVVMHNINGSIKARIGGGNSMNLVVYEKVRENSKIDANALLEEARVITRREGSRLIVEIDYGRFKDSRHKGYYQSSYEVSLPQRLSVMLETTNGRIEAPAFDGDVTLETTNGSIKSKGSGGMAKLETTNGSIHIDMVRGSVDAETTNGNIIISSVGGPVTAETTNGSIEVSLTNGLKGDVSLETTNGSIEFSPGSSADFTVRADTSNGKVYGGDGLEYNKRRNYARGSFGSGRYKVNLDTTNGSIRIKR